jgi:hypothetical protein
LADELQKVFQHTRELSSALWRDIAIVFGTFVIKFALESSKTAHDPHIFSYIFVILAFYVVISFWMNTRIFNDFWVVSENSLDVWRSKLYAFLDEGDFDKLAREPLKQAKIAYKQTFRRGRIIVLIIFIVLFLKAGIDLDQVNIVKVP